MRTSTLVILLLVVVVVSLIPHIQAQYWDNVLETSMIEIWKERQQQERLEKLVREAKMREIERIKLNPIELRRKKREFWKGFKKFLKQGEVPYGCSGFACVYTHLAGNYRWTHKGTEESEEYYSYVQRCKRDPDCVFDWKYVWKILEPLFDRWLYSGQFI
ncbi:uncharacterized protein LOC106079558 [Biomphalaria glabrata]|uniref:Uncharacterized protein LOC106079558 n=1 Tax=Biomphalaria glabrata TaxID=6526 RepID=A0A9W3BNF5_BIOGL|nr:uncharacterized protein LOC106079558 [Biomphalaria glabrata]